MLSTLFPFSTPIDPAAPEPQRADFAHIPAKPAVYLLTGPTPDLKPQLPITNYHLPPTDHPLLLATVGDLRSALKRRLADTPPDTKSKRIAYAQIATRIYYRPVFSPFAANFHYAHAARILFSQTADALVPWAAPNASWWLAVERPGTTPFPRIRKTNSLGDPEFLYAGPIRDKHAANRLVETLEDLFDLCRYHNILIQAPHGKACAYKEMGKCPAPCDGTIPLAQYHQQIQAAWSFLTNTPPSPDASHQTQGLQSLGLSVENSRLTWRKNLERDMKSAAARLEFETANRLKQRLARADAVNHEAFTHIAPLGQFSFLSLQRGQGKPWIEPWLIHGGQIEPLPQFHRKNLPTAAQSLAERLAKISTVPIPQGLTPVEASAIALVAHHLFSPRPAGLFLPLRQFSADPVQISARIVQAAETLLAKPVPAATLPEQSSDPDVPAAVVAENDATA